jgi:acyl-CoA reductase-like NAD-dependent aldehyde dehydrogenase
MIETTAQPRTIPCTDRASGNVLRELACATTAEVNAAVARGRAAQPAWAATPVTERLQILHNFQRKLYDAADEVAALISQETGKPRVEALLTEVVVVLDAVSFYRREVPKRLRPERVPHANIAMKAKRAYLLREPQGVIGIISPWNYPFSTPASEMLAALATRSCSSQANSRHSPRSN